MSLADRYLEESVGRHMEGTLEAHRAWSAAQEAIAAEYEARTAQLAAWRVMQMADADSRYRAALGTQTSQLVTQLPPVITRAIESGQETPDAIPL